MLKKLKSAFNLPKNRRLVLLVFLVGFASMLFFTLGINFFWEDFYFIDSRMQSVPEAAIKFFKVLFTEKQFFNISYMDRPLQFLSYGALPVFFGTDVLFYRILSALTFAVIVTLLFLFIKKSTNTLFGLAAVLSVLFIPDYWLAIVYIQDVNKYTELFVILAYFIFFYFYRKENNFKRVLLYFILIILFLRISILLKHVGRLFIFIVALFLLLTNYPLIKRKKYIFLMIASFLISFPFLGLLKEGFNSISMGMAVGEMGIIASLLNLFGKSYHVLGMILGATSFIVLAFSIIIHFYVKIKRKSYPTKKSKEVYNLVIFSLLWFLFSVILVYSARGFMYVDKYFQRYDTIYMICAFFIFLYSYAFYVTGFLKKKHKSFIRTSFIIILMLGALFNLYSLNQWRGAWGDYFMAWQRTKDKIDDGYSDSLLIVPATNSIPFVPLPTDKNTYIMESELNNLEKIELYSHNYSDVFIANRGPIDFNDSASIELYDKIKAKDNSLYAKVKKILKRTSYEVIYVYKYKEDSREKD